LARAASPVHPQASRLFCPIQPPKNPAPSSSAVTFKLFLLIFNVLVGVYPSLGLSLYVCVDGFLSFYESAAVMICFMNLFWASIRSQSQSMFNQGPSTSFVEGIYD